MEKDEVRDQIKGIVNGINSALLECDSAKGFIIKRGEVCEVDLQNGDDQEDVKTSARNEVNRILKQNYQMISKLVRAAPTKWTDIDLQSLTSQQDICLTTLHSCGFIEYEFACHVSFVNTPAASRGLTLKGRGFGLMATLEPSAQLDSILRQKKIAISNSLLRIRISRWRLTHPFGTTLRNQLLQDEKAFKENLKNAISLVLEFEYSTPQRQMPYLEDLKKNGHFNVVGQCEILACDEQLYKDSHSEKPVVDSQKAKMKVGQSTNRPKSWEKPGRKKTGLRKWIENQVKVSPDLKAKKLLEKWNGLSNHERKCLAEDNPEHARQFIGKDRETGINMIQSNLSRIKEAKKNNDK